MASDLALTENAETVAVASRTLENAKKFAASQAIPNAFGSYGELIADPAVEAIYLGTPHAVHHAMAVEAMNAGKHVLCEKPVAVNSSELDDLIRTAVRTGVFFMEAMWMKFNPAILSLRAAIANGAIGEPRSVRASFGIPFPVDSSSRWRADMHGSALLDQGIYPITLAEMVLGAPARIQSSGLVRPDGVDLTEFVTLEYEDGRAAQLSSSMVEFNELTASINGTKGWITLPRYFWAQTAYTVHRPSREDFAAADSVEFPREGYGYVPMLRAASDAIRGGLQEHPSHTWDDSMRVFRILDLVRSQLASTVI